MLIQYLLRKHLKMPRVSEQVFLGQHSNTKCVLKCTTKYLKVPSIQIMQLEIISNRKMLYLILDFPQENALFQSLLKGYLKMPRKPFSLLI